MEDYIINDYGQTKITLLDENVEHDLQLMETKLISFNKKLKEIKEYCDELDDQSYALFAMNSQDIHETIEDCERFDKEIAQLGDTITDYNISNLVKRQKVNEKKSQCLQKLEYLRSDLEKTVLRIEAKEKKFNDTKYDNERRENSGYTNGNGNGNDVHLDDNKQLKVVKLNSNSEFLAQRRKDLEEIKKTSAQVKSISEQFKVDVHQQGESLNSIEDQIKESEENVGKAENEIKKADETSKKSRKKLLWLIGIVAFVTLSAALIAYLVYINVAPTPTPPTPKPDPPK